MAVHVDLQAPPEVLRQRVGIAERHRHALPRGRIRAVRSVAEEDDAIARVTRRVRASELVNVGAFQMQRHASN